jgi:hypothetical protein
MSIYKENFKRLKIGNNWIKEKRIGIDGIPYIKSWKEEIKFIIMVLHISRFLPDEVIRIIGYNYLNVLRLLTMSTLKIDLSNICYCSESVCLLKWSSLFDNLTSLIDYQMVFHCSVITNNKQCHYTGYRENGNICLYCTGFTCNNCSVNHGAYLECNTCNKQKKKKIKEGIIY